MSFTLYFLYFYSSRRKRSSNEIVFTIDMVHILPGYPKSSAAKSSITLLAFYLQLPQGFSDNIVDQSILKDIVESDKSNIGKSVGFTILSVQPLISTTAETTVSTTAETTEERGEKSRPMIVLIIGAFVGGLIVGVILIVLVLRFKKRKR